MNSKILTAAVIVLGVLSFYLKSSKQEPATVPMQAPAKGLVPLPQVTAEAPNAKGPSITDIQQERSTFRDANRLRIAYFNPKTEKNAFVFPLRYTSISRPCINGDIDLIQRVVKAEQALLWTLEDQDGKSVMPPRMVLASRLAEGFTQTITFPISSKPRYYRLSLCHATGQSCSGIKPINFDTIELARKRKEISSGLFFSQNFRVDASGIRIFDSREFKDAAGYKSYLEKADGNTDAAGFVEEMQEIQKILKPLPVRIQGDGLDINLFLRDDKGC